MGYFVLIHIRAAPLKRGSARVAKFYLARDAVSLSLFACCWPSTYREGSLHPVKLLPIPNTPTFLHPDPPFLPEPLPEPQRVTYTFEASASFSPPPFWLLRMSAYPLPPHSVNILLQSFLLPAKPRGSYMELQVFSSHPRDRRGVDRVAREAGLKRGRSRLRTSSQISQKNRPHRGRVSKKTSTATGHRQHPPTRRVWGASGVRVFSQTTFLTI